MAPRAFPQLIRSCREAQGFKSQAQVASELRVSPAFMCDLEKGYRKATLEKAIQLAYILDGDDAGFVQVLLQDQLDEAGVKYRVTVHRDEPERKRGRR